MERSNMRSMKLPAFYVKLASLLIISILIIGPISGQTNVLLNINSISREIPVVLTFGNSLEEQLAIQTIQENYPLAVFIDYVNFIKSIDVINEANFIIWIGHGTNLGIKHDLLGNITWDAISTRISQTNAINHYFLSCDSGIITLLNQETGKNVVSFDGVVDAIWVASLVSAFIAQETNNFYLFKKTVKNVADRFFEIVLTNDILEMGSFSDPEASALFVMAFATLMLVLFPITLVAAFAIRSAVAWSIVLLGASMGVFTAAVYTFVDDSTNLNKMWALIVAIVAMFSAFSALHTALMADQATFALPGKLLQLLLTIGPAIISLRYHNYFKDHDLNDCNDIPAKDEPGAYSFKLDPRAGCPPPPNKPPKGIV